MEQTVYIVIRVPEYGDYDDGDIVGVFTKETDANTFYALQGRQARFAVIPKVVDDPAHLQMIAEGERRWSFSVTIQPDGTRSVGFCIVAPAVLDDHIHLHLPSAHSPRPYVLCQGTVMAKSEDHARVKALNAAAREYANLRWFAQLKEGT